MDERVSAIHAKLVGFQVAPEPDGTGALFFSIRCALPPGTEEQEVLRGLRMEYSRGGADLTITVRGTIPLED